MSKKFDLLVFIGRFQPFHLEHKRIIDIALTQSKYVLVLVGSSGKARTIRNPWTYPERKRMIQENYPSRYYGEGSEWSTDDSALIIRPLFDKTYNDAAWIRQVQDIVKSVALDIANPGQVGKVFQPNGINKLRIGLIGANKDHSSFYLRLFPQWDSVDVPIQQDINATNIREAYFSGQDWNTDLVPENVRRFMYSEYSPGLEYGFCHTGFYETLASELEFVRKYKQSWAAAPYPPIFVTTDSVVVCSGHVLLVTRKANPGKGLLALPGGFLNQYEKVIDGMIRELREETKIKVPEPVLRGSIQRIEFFDDPYRSTRGRTITHCGLIKLADGPLPKIKGSDDAATARWIELAKLEPDQFFEDHYEIIQYLIGL